jgi:hypothetical protein
MLLEGPFERPTVLTDCTDNISSLDHRPTVHVETLGRAVSKVQRSNNYPAGGTADKNVGWDRDRC